MSKSFEECLENIKNNTSSNFEELEIKAKQESKKIKFWFLRISLCS